ncbi:MAG: right-handed parallel beta-helix repeat-containing protein [Phycisphaerales bacterium]|jgi:choloylglycine hydrolase
MHKLSSIILSLLLTQVLFACSTFMLKNESAFIIGQNLDMPYSIPGYITKNNRGVVKKNITWREISQNAINTSPIIEWTSKYGSITFTPICREFPEGGINEAGLYIREMSLSGTQFPIDNTIPNMFMMQWIQYQLDNYSTVHEVLDHIDDIILDGWAWHFFVADAEGNTAAIEFLNREPVIHTGASMPYPVLANSTYESELVNISRYEGFGGTIPVDINNRSGDDRFVQAANMIKNSTSSNLEDPVDYGFQILDRALGSGGTQWSIIIDMNQLVIYFKTSIAREIKHFSYGDFDYSCSSPAKIANLNSSSSGDVSQEFVDYSRHQSLLFIGDGVEKVFSISLAPNILKNTHDYICTTYCEITDPNQTQPSCTNCSTIENLRTGQHFDSIECAIALANPGDEIILSPNIYYESIDLSHKDIIVRSIDPNDPFYVGSTIIQGSADSPVITLQENLEACEIAGLTIRAGSIGIVGSATDATIRNCRIMDNTTHGLELSEGSSPALKRCLITANGQTGITMLRGPGRSNPSCTPLIQNCIIVNNGQSAIDGGEPFIIDSTITNGPQ